MCFPLLEVLGEEKSDLLSPAVQRPWLHPGYPDFHCGTQNFKLLGHSAETEAEIGRAESY